MRKLPWKKITWACVVTVALILGRVAVSVGRAWYYNGWQLPDLGEPGWAQEWQRVLLPPVQQDPWVYVGFAVAALGIFAWVMIPGKKQESQEVSEEIL